MLGLEKIPQKLGLVEEIVPDETTGETALPVAEAPTGESTADTPAAEPTAQPAQTPAPTTEPQAVAATADSVVLHGVPDGATITINGQNAAATVQNGDAALSKTALGDAAQLRVIANQGGNWRAAAIWYTADQGSEITLSDSNFLYSGSEDGYLEPDDAFLENVALNYYKAFLNAVNDHDLSEMRFSTARNTDEQSSHVFSDLNAGNTYDTDKPLESGNVTDWTYTYDDQGRITSKTGYLMGDVAATYTYTYTDEDYTEESDYWVYGSRTHTYRTYSPEGVLRKEEVYTQYEGVDEYKTEETTYFLGKPALTSYYATDGSITAQKVWDWEYYTHDYEHVQLTKFSDVTQLASGYESHTYDMGGNEIAHESSHTDAEETVTNYTYTYDDDGNIIGRTAYTDGVLTEEITYTVAKVPKDYSFDTVTEADYKYKEYVMAD